MMKPRRYPLVIRLARIESELSYAARLLHLLMDDMLDVQEEITEAQNRITVVLGVTGALALVCGASGQAVGDWVIATAPDGNLDDADEFGAAVIEQIMLNATDPEGEA